MKPLIIFKWKSNDLMTLPDNERSSWHLAKSQTLTVVSSEQEQNFKSVLQKLLRMSQN